MNFFLRTYKVNKPRAFFSARYHALQVISASSFNCDIFYGDVPPRSFRRKKRQNNAHLKAKIAVCGTVSPLGSENLYRNGSVMIFQVGSGSEFVIFTKDHASWKIIALKNTVFT